MDTRHRARDAFLSRLSHGEPAIMGILNVTPDSFYDGGFHVDPDEAVAHAAAMERDGAAIIDIGGESTRPGSEPVPAEEELARVAAVVGAVCERCTVPVSIDTWKASVAREAVRRGAAVINDVWGLARDPMMAATAAETGAAVVAMHNREGIDASLDMVGEVCAAFERSLERAAAAGVPHEHVLLDPGIGFGKTLEQNIACLRAIGRFRQYGRPVLIGLSRKSMIGRILRNAVEDRLVGTLALNQLAVMEGAAVIRVHDVAQHRQMLDMLSALDVLEAAGRAPPAA